MYQPEAYAAALFFMIISMVCWGSWANTMKLTPGYAFPLFYWDYLVGMVLGALVLGFTLGSHGGAGSPFLADLRAADIGHILYALLAGIIFNVANLLLVAAIEIAGLGGGLSDRHRTGTGGGRADELPDLATRESVPVVQRNRPGGPGDHL